ncbi:MAG: preprotein translocase subunit SecE [Betaproteobacteria bacterium]|nr:preprotein translocase subunit SecE [Betaproteobacteria bacterium]
MADKIKIAVGVALLIAGIAAFYYWSESLMIVRVVAVIGGAVAGAVVFLTTAPGKEFFAFAQESVEETKRVVWPTRKETLQTTGVVFAFVVVMAIFLWLVDAGLLWAVRLLMGRGDS